jgi:hypothetical protein
MNEWFPWIIMGIVMIVGIGLLLLLCWWTNE